MEDAKLRLNLTLTGQFSAGEADRLRRALGEHLQVDKPRALLFRSTGPDVCSLIEVIGDATNWLPLKVAATAYLSRLAYHASDATWNALRSRFKREETKPLADVADALAATANKVEGEVEIVLGLNIPNNHFGTCVSIEDREPEEIARQLAALIVRIENVSEAMQAEIDAGRRPIGGARIEVRDDGSLLIRWQREADGKECEKDIP